MASVIIALENKKAFEQSPPAGWRLDATSNKIICEDQSVTVLTTDKKFQGRSTCLEVGNAEELNDIRQMTQSKPILMTVRCTKSYSDPTSKDANDNFTKVEDYVVLINTQHQQIAEQFNEAFEMAEQHLKEGKKFRININLSESIRIWFRNNVPVHNESKESSQAWGADIYISYGIGEPNFADRCFHCEVLQQKIFCGVSEHKIKKAVPVTFHQGPFQMGFNLFNLFYPPGTTITTIVTNQPNSIQQPLYNNQQPAYHPTSTQQTASYQQSGGLPLQGYPQHPSGPSYQYQQRDYPQGSYLPGYQQTPPQAYQ